MSIFLSKKAKENFKGFWYGLLLPIIVGVGISLLSMGVMIRFESYFVGPDDNFIEYFFLFCKKGTVTLIVLLYKMFYFFY